jgi:hypothetical protein
MTDVVPRIVNALAGSRRPDVVGRRLTDDELRAWAQTQAVFISSVMTELATERRSLA